MRDKNKVRTKLFYKLLKYNTFKFIIYLTFESKYDSL